MLSLISGGFDSGVSSYMLMRRGSRVHYCFFNLGGAAHEIGVRQVAHYLWNRFGRSHRVRFVAINFEPVVGEILEKNRRRSNGRGAETYDGPCSLNGGGALWRTGPGHR